MLELHRASSAKLGKEQHSKPIFTEDWGADEYVLLSL